MIREGKRYESDRQGHETDRQGNENDQQKVRLIGSESDTDQPESENDR